MPSDDPHAESLQNLLWLINDVDNLIEHAMLRRSSLADVMPNALDLLLKYIDASAVTVRVGDGTGETRDFTRPGTVDVMKSQINSICDRLAHVNSVWVQQDHGMVYGQRLDMSIEYLGAVIAHFEDRHPDEQRDHTQRALFHWAEIVDNYVASVVDANVKQSALERISSGFQQTILENALDAAIGALEEYVEFETLILVCQSDEVMEKSTYSYRIIVNGEPEYSSSVPPDPRVEKLVEDAVVRLLRSETVDDVLDELHVRSPYLEDVPIYDLDGTRIIGRVVVGSAQEITPFSSDIVDRFADYLRQRVVDFSREWRMLSRTFPKAFVERLLREGNYAERFAPREEPVVVLYSDIAGFTRLSEQVLREPAIIGRLIDRWSRHVVEIIWETGGVFDKMVGDCVIGLWGPPFYERDAAEICEAALSAARRIREFTAGLVQDPEFPELAESPFPIGVATGINYCPICVGLFGPNEAFTGFSSGMNNAARLQGLAEIDEILCMDSFVEALGDGSSFGDERQEAVKNVAEPLRYRMLVDG